MDSTLKVNYFYDPSTSKSLTTVVTQDQYRKLLQDPVFSQYLFQEAKKLSQQSDRSPFILTHLGVEKYKKDHCQLTEKSTLNINLSKDKNAGEFIDLLADDESHEYAELEVLDDAELEKQRLEIKRQKVQNDAKKTDLIASASMLLERFLEFNGARK